MLTSSSTVLRNPIYFVFLILLGSGLYVTYNLNLWDPMLRMANAASQQAVEVGKDRLREFLDAPPPAIGARPRRQAMSMSVSSGEKQDVGEEIEMDGLGTSHNEKAVAADI